MAGLAGDGRTEGASRSHGIICTLWVAVYRARCGRGALHGGGRQIGMEVSYGGQRGVGVGIARGGWTRGVMLAGVGHGGAMCSGPVGGRVRVRGSRRVHCGVGRMARS